MSSQKQVLAIVGLFSIFPISLVILWLLTKNTLTLTLVGMIFLWSIFVDKVPFNGQGRVIKSLRRSNYWKLIRDYFPAKMLQVTELSSKTKYIFAIHPHGIFCSGAWLNFVTDSTDFSRKNNDLDVAVATVSLNFYIPIWRDFLLGMGFIDASLKSVENALDRGRSLMIAVGGAAESLECHPGKYNLVLNKRKGFIRLALSHGVSLVPVFTFGETEVYLQISNPQKSIIRQMQEFGLSVFKFAIPLLKVIFPRRTKLTTVIGKPIVLPKILNPSSKQVEEYHNIYKKELFKLVNSYKDICGEPNAELNIVL